ncbi:protein-glutamate O-methyltransferase CheR [Phenylobacterium sp.]|uniref:CheR family methyltransferase n=1 Tax=Phenylobacterium sp. TaxID=1871053 RepID=UPI00281152BD|nr:protein-glutamate O-methyltransferase CheR [Phenylobacterium sp.]
MISLEDRELVAAVCASRAGLRVDPDKAYLIESRLAPVARREGFGSLAQYIETVRLRGEERLVWAMVEAMAPPETAFFRDPQVFDALVREVLPELVRQAAGPVRVWSAACGAGQEIYSLAMLLAEQPALAARVELFASDLSERSLEKAQAGLYSQFEVQRGLPARRLVRHFEREGEFFALSPRIRQMVRWRRVNLLDDLSRAGRFELILCRNVLAGLTGEARERVLENLTGALAPGGRLVLGLTDHVEAWMDPVAAEAGVFAIGQAAAA